MRSKLKFAFLLIFIVVLFVIINSCASQKKTNYKIKYDGLNFNVYEKKYSNNYYIEVKKGDLVFPFRVYNKSGKKIVEKVFYYEDDEYKCLLPIVKNYNNSIMCYYDGIIYDYQAIKGNNKNLDEYIKTLTEYKISNFEDDLSQVKTVDDTTFYISNDIDRYIYITSYRGLTNSNESINIFDNDVYSNKLSTFVNNYYIVADYNNDYEFNYFYVVNLKNQKINKIKSRESISMDSYIQGVVNDKVYLYDKDNQKQYEIDIDKNKVIEISTQSKIKYYKNNKWSMISKPSRRNEVYFDYNTLNNYFTDYDKVIETDNYYYLLKRQNENFELYRVDVNNIDVVKFLIEVPTSDIRFIDDFLFYSYNDKMYYYSDVSGFRTIFQNKELMFNNTIKFYVYGE